MSNRTYTSLPLAFALGAALLVSGTALAGKPAGKGNGSTDTSGTTTSSSSGMTIATENYNFRGLSGDNSCIGEDDILSWKAKGSLQPGESFTFTPQYPACRYHPAAIMAQLSWEGSTLELSSHVPDVDMATGDLEQKGKKIVAPVVRNSAQLCMFPLYRDNGTYYSITVTNTGSTTAQNIVLEGLNDNDWASNFYARCMNADADHDGWNDSLEHSMANMLYPIGYIGDELQRDILWGSNYLRGKSVTSMQDDEIDSSPADFNDDGIIDERDIEAISWFIGEGNGIALQNISPNPGDAEFVWNNIFEWRRYDLNGDGYVTQADSDIVSALKGQPLPMTKDVIPPSSRVISPRDNETIAKGNYVRIQGHIWDNAAIDSVEYLVNGRTVCSSQDAANPLLPLVNCWWSVPKKAGDYQLSIRITDMAGNVTTSPSTRVIAQ